MQCIKVLKKMILWMALEEVELINGSHSHSILILSIIYMLGDLKQTGKLVI